MIEIHVSDEGIAEIEFEDALTSQDFDKVRGVIDDYINEKDRAPNLLIHLHQMVHWSSFKALQKHFRLVRDHHRLIKKVAVVGDVPLLNVAPEIANHFVAATIRRFPERSLRDARSWLASEVDEIGDFEVLAGLPDDVVAVRLKGIITAKAYREKLIPLIEKKLETHEKIKCMAVVGEEFISYSAEAAWDDTMLGIRYWNRFARIGLVTDINWLRVGARLFAPLIPGKFRLFPLDELDDALSWIKR